MEKQVFLDRVRQRLLQNGISSATVERQITRLSRYIEEEGGANAEAMLDEEDPLLLAEEICAALRRNAARRAAAEAVIEAAEEAPVRPAPAPRPAPTAVMKPPVVSDAATREMDIVHPSQTFDIVDLPSGAGAEAPAADFTGMPAADYFDSSPAEPYVPEQQEETRGQKRRGGMLEVDPLRSRAVEYESEKAGPLFWVIFILSLPFAAAIGLAVIGLFVVAFAALAGLMVLSIAALAAVAAVGTAFTLVSLVYGIVQALSVLPVGLYEIGIGITAGAIVLFVSILLYNFAIRLLPFTMKQLARFFGWTVRSLKTLFIYVKGACAKL